MLTLHFANNITHYQDDEWQAAWDVMSHFVRIGVKAWLEWISVKGQ